MVDIQPFKIDVAEDRLVHLRKRLELSTLPEKLSDPGWDLGAPLADIRRLQ